MRKSQTLILLLILLVGCSNSELTSYSGTITEIIDGDTGYERVTVEGLNGGDEDTIIFIVPNDVNEGVEVGNKISVYYDPDAFREDSLPPTQDGVERIEVYVERN
ncbi:hypothetical protein [Geomicrobium sp. JCM 19038]|uniref:hypothetical protein n=1 Tax=Geomicrobium sp. JCM 19038 TaxID=1460635 RepID=UPI00045F418B|nr:hypothetical protein [Geomicrobium sp. JCM 19038]GAK09137.1 hypothetical protein JCM19038_2957 [Geomicrobium sp. JCM 19038]